MQVFKATANKLKDKKKFSKFNETVLEYLDAQNKGGNLP